MNNWQPIETAPKDGTEILGYVDGYRATVSWLSHGDTLMPIKGYWNLVVSGFDASDGEWSPTHWMPLPDPPEQP